MQSPSQTHANCHNRAKRLEISRRLPGAAHPDQCPTLHCRGVAFAVPARPESRIAFRFDADKAKVVQLRCESRPDAIAVMELAPIRQRTCRRCGQVTDATLAVDLGRHERFLAACATLAGRLLREQYQLSGDEIAWLLAFAPDRLPDWLAEVTQWAQIGRTELPAPAPAAAPITQPWWAFWR